MTAHYEIMTGDGWKPATKAQWSAHRGPRLVDGKPSRTFARWPVGSKEPMREGTAVDLCPACREGWIWTNLAETLSHAFVGLCSDCRSAPGSYDGEW